MHIIAPRCRLKGAVAMAKGNGVVDAVVTFLVIFVHITLRCFLSHAGKSKAYRVKGIHQLLTCQGVDTVYLLPHLQFLFSAHVLCYHKLFLILTDSVELGMPIIADVVPD